MLCSRCPETSQGGCAQSQPVLLRTPGLTHSDPPSWGYCGQKRSNFARVASERALCSSFVQGALQILISVNQFTVKIKHVTFKYRAIGHLTRGMGAVKGRGVSSMVTEGDLTLGGGCTVHIQTTCHRIVHLTPIRSFLKTFYVLILERGKEGEREEEEPQCETETSVS